MKYFILSAIAAGAAVALFNCYSPSPRTTEEQIINDGGKVLRVGDRLTEYFVYGASPQTATKSLLAIHGAMTTGQLWKEHDQWGRENNVLIICPSLPGWGLSEPSYDASMNLTRTPKDWAENDALLLLKTLGFSSENKVHLVGASLGSIYAAALASSEKTSPLIANVMLYVAFAPPSMTNDPLLNSQLRVFSQMHSVPILARTFEKIVVLPLLRSSLPGDAGRSLKTQWEGLWKCTDDIYAPWDFPYQSLTQQRKVVVVSGKSDNLAPPHNQQALRTLIPGAQLVEYEGGHDDGVRKPH
jgi:pimeloyl-ACP methyl ester carboxylesterase